MCLFRTNHAKPDNRAEVSLELRSDVRLILIFGFAAVSLVRNLGGALDVAVNSTAAKLQVAGAAGHISSASQSVAQGSSEQAASLEGTASFGSRVRASAQKNAEAARAAAQLTARVDAGMTQANQALDQLLAAMRDVDVSSREISKIIQVIEEIAFQTNLLALNAAVDAALAGAE